MDEIERIEEERFIEGLIHLWIQSDAPKWIVDYVRQELRKGRGLLEDSKEDRSMTRWDAIKNIMNDLDPCLTAEDFAHGLAVSFDNYDCATCKLKSDCDYRLYLHKPDGSIIPTYDPDFPDCQDMILEWLNGEV